jgi:hypothetical protein
MTSTDAYVLGHYEGEIECLKSQAQFIDPITRRIFHAAGVGSGVRVLDVASQAGDVAFMVDAQSLIFRHFQIGACSQVV